MTHTVSTRSSDPAPLARARPFPVLETGNGSFPDAVYSVTIGTERPGQSIRVAHAVENAPLLQRWIADGAVRFLCAVSAPISAYRRVSKSDTPEQIVEWNLDDLGSPPAVHPDARVEARDRARRRRPSRRAERTVAWTAAAAPEGRSRGRWNRPSSYKEASRVSCGYGL